MRGIVADLSCDINKSLTLRHSANKKNKKSILSREKNIQHSPYSLCTFW
jgi:hypothetical protein